MLAISEPEEVFEMLKAIKVTLLVVPVLCVVSLLAGPARASSAAAMKPGKVVMRADDVEKAIQPEVAPVISGDVQISRSASLYDHQDGSRSDDMEYLFLPQLKTSIGAFKAKIIYAQNLRDDTGHIYDGKVNATDWGDVAVTYSLIPNKWRWSYPYMITLTPFATAVIPASQNSLKRDDLKTSLSAGLSFAIIPDGVSPSRDGNWSLAVGISGGQNIHAYSTDVNGKVLNKYLSNQTLNLGYAYKAVSFMVEFINKTRWTYEGNVKSAFVHSEEIGFAINEHVGLAIGHSNTGSALKANALDSNLDFINENDSSIYGSLSLSF